MPDLSPLLEHWRYPIIFAVVILGNVGLPVPEESVLALGGYLAQRGDLRLTGVIVAGVLAAVIGDNLGYWAGRRYGQEALERYGRYVWITPTRLQRATAAMARYGGLAVFAARFVPGVRTLAGPVAGATGMRPLTFVAGNALGALTYVPYAVGLGYALGYGAGHAIERVIGRAEPVFVAAIAVVTLVLLARRLMRRAPAR
ncbi:MAG TPA: DedA family protein [Methylomirabilota bacterium]|jgi:membrane protein DedA with SNARE-associated domain